jgi:hypothetical protein
MIPKPEAGPPSEQAQRSEDGGPVYIQQSQLTPEDAIDIARQHARELNMPWGPDVKVRSRRCVTRRTAAKRWI